MKVNIPAYKLIVTTATSTGQLAGECLLCGALGWIDNIYGYPHWNKKITPTRLIHKERCELGRRLTEDGKIRKGRE